ncbi:MAG: hypothetical protein L6265_06675 [Thermoplasmatales archaeon]|nr:hypothetical protein [Thermoplasmatales archaeon]
MFGTLETTSGYWNAIIFVITFVVIALVVYILRSFGEKTYKKDSEQTKPFLSGNPEPEKENVHVRAGNLFWGFTEALKEYYKPTVKGHTGVVNDYVYWFVIVLAVLFIVIGVGT